LPSPAVTHRPPGAKVSVLGCPVAPPITVTHGDSSDTYSRIAPDSGILPCNNSARRPDRSVRQLEFSERAPPAVLARLPPAAASRQHPRSALARHATRPGHPPARPGHRGGVDERPVTDAAAAPDGRSRSDPIRSDPRAGHRPPPRTKRTRSAAWPTRWPGYAGEPSSRRHPTGRGRPWPCSSSPTGTTTWGAATWGAASARRIASACSASSDSRRFGRVGEAA
jgi:hypothetical protein